MATNGVKDLISRIEKKFGKEAVSHGTANVDFLHSGSFGLDIALGGGWAIGRIIEIYGPESCGKTTAAIHAAVEMQKTGRAVGYVDVEQAMDPEYMQSLGLDMSDEKFILSQPDNAEQAMEIVSIMCEEPAIGLVVLDSVAGLTPTATLMGEAGDAKVALVARLMSAQLNILKNICKKNNCILFCINQIRDKVGGGFGFGAATTQTPGGRALRFYSSQRAEMARIGSEKEGEETVANKTRITVKKNKVAKPYRKCDILIRFGIGFDQIQEIVDLAIEYKICTKKGSFFYYGSGDDSYRLGQGMANVREILAKDSALLEEIKDLTTQAIQEAEAKEEEDETD